MKSRIVFVLHFNYQLFRVNKCHLLLISPGVCIPEEIESHKHLIFGMSSLQLEVENEGTTSTVSLDSYDPNRDDNCKFV